MEWRANGREKYTITFHINSYLLLGNGISDKGVLYTPMGREWKGSRSISRTFKCNSRACIMWIVCKCVLSIVAGNIYLQILIIFFHGSTTNDDNFEGHFRREWLLWRHKFYQRIFKRLHEQHNKSLFFFPKDRSRLIEPRKAAKLYNFAPTCSLFMPPWMLIGLTKAWQIMIKST